MVIPSGSAPTRTLWAFPRLQGSHRGWHRGGEPYPGASRRALQQAVAERHGVPTQRHRPWERVHRDPPDGGPGPARSQLRLVAPAPTFEDVFEYSEPHPWIDLKPVPLLPDYSHDLTAMEEATKGGSRSGSGLCLQPQQPYGISDLRG